LEILLLLDDRWAKSRPFDGLVEEGGYSHSNVSILASLLEIVSTGRIADVPETRFSIVS